MAPGELYLISDLELASRLSFFLWSRGPDAELIEIASEGTLRDPAVLEQQVQRMLADPRSDQLVQNFAGQWLGLRILPGTAPAPQVFPDFDDTLRQAYRRETELFFESIMREDRNVVDLLTADYTFVNERLAKAYGIPDIYGPEFQRVTLSEDMDYRRGLLGKGSVLLQTSLTTRTSPVQRGKWVLQNILGTQPSRAAAERAGVEDQCQIFQRPGNGSRGFGANPDAKTPREPILFVLPSDHGSDWLRALEL